MDTAALVVSYLSLLADGKELPEANSLEEVQAQITAENLAYRFSHNGGSSVIVSLVREGKELVTKEQLQALRDFQGGLIDGSIRTGESGIVGANGAGAVDGNQSGNIDAGPIADRP